MASCKLANIEEKMRKKKKNETYILKIDFTKTTHD